MNRVEALLASDEEVRGAVDNADAVMLPPEHLQAVWPITGDPSRDRVPPRPDVPLSSSDLLVNARGEPALAHALANEIPPQPTASTCSAPSYDGTGCACSKRP